MTSTPDILDVYTDYIDPDLEEYGEEWEGDCDCWCSICGCHGLCTREDFYDEDIDYEEEDD